MNSFLDSNVILNYIFAFDKYHLESKFVIFNSINYYSQNVQKEVIESFIRKNKEYKSFLLAILNFMDKFSDYDVMNEYIIQQFISGFKSIGKFKVNDMHSVFDKIWNNLGFDDTQDVFEVKLKFDYFIKEFQFLHQFRKDAVLNALIQVPNHSKKDKNILDLIKKENLRDNLLHDKDEDILFDANEFCKNNQDLNLKFVSADQDFLKAIDILMDVLCINESINLIEFSNN